MNTQSDETVRQAIASIVRRSLTRVRELARKGDSDAVDVEAYHVHNLPGLLANFSVSRLRYYWDVERPEYLAKGGAAAVHEDDWGKIAHYLATQGGDST